MVHLNIDPDQASDFVARMKASPTIIAAGWTSGKFDMERTIRFAAANWRDGGKINKDKLAATLSSVMAKALAATALPSKWNDDNGELKLSFRRPNSALPGLGLTQTIEISAMAASDKPGGSDKLLLWIGYPAITTTDENAGAKLKLSDTSDDSGEESVPVDEGDTVTAVAHELKAQLGRGKHHLEVIATDRTPPYDVIVVGAGLGGLTAAAILARAGRKVLVVERSNSVGGAASSYKVGDLFVEGSLHETSDPRRAGDPKHDALSRAGVLDAVTWVPSTAFYEVRGGPLKTALALPDDFDAARAALIDRFPEAGDGIDLILREMQQAASAAATDATTEALSLSRMFDRVFGDNEAVKCALAANLCYYHDDPATLSWRFFAEAQGAFPSQRRVFRPRRIAAAVERAGAGGQGRRGRRPGPPHRRYNHART